MSAKIFSVFPACGKTWLYNHQKDFKLKILDSDSSGFSWLAMLDEEYADKNRGKKDYVPRYFRTRNPMFPDNYIQHIKENLDKYDCIFVSSHASVREALDKEGIDFTIVYPHNSCKAEWVGRCYIREENGEGGCSAKIMCDNWEQWIAECSFTGTNHKKIVLNSKEHLSDYYKKIKKRF